MLEPVRRFFLIIYYLFYNLLKGNQEWKCDIDEAPKLPPTPTCCAGHAARKNTFGTCDFAPAASFQKSWWQRVKEKTVYYYNYWFGGRSVAYLPRPPPPSGESTLWRWLKFLPTQIWRGVKWLSRFLLSLLSWICAAFLKIFQGPEATDDRNPATSYTYRRIESPKDYLPADDAVVDTQTNEPIRAPFESESAVVEEALATTETPEMAAPEQPTTPKSPAIPAVDAPVETPISFYARRVSVSSTSSDKRRTPFSPPPPPPPMPTSVTRIPTSPPMEVSKVTKEPESPIVGGVSVMVPGLMDAAKEAAERRQRGRTMSPGGQEHRTPVRGASVTVAEGRPSGTLDRAPFSHRNGESVVTRIDTHTTPGDAAASTQQFLFRPRSQTSRNLETNTHYNHWRQSEERHGPRPYGTPLRTSVSPTPSGTYLLGSSVFKPVTEVEKIRDNFNRKCESRAASVVGGYSRSPSVMSQSYDGTLDYREPPFESGLRQRGSVQAMSRQFAGAPAPGKWSLRDTDDDPIFSRYSSGVTRKVLERKVTEKHLEKDSHGQVLNGWREQNWMGTYEEFTPML